MGSHEEVQRKYQNIRANHKQFRSLLKKFRRKFKRQAIAKARDEQKTEQGELCLNNTNELEEEDDRKLEEEERERQNLLWLQREKQAQEKFEKKMKLEEFQRKRAEEIMKQREEIALQQKERATMIQEKKEEVSKLASQEDGPWINPVPPTDYSIEEREKCSFFQKTGCCRFGDRCSRSHPKPENCVTLLIKGMYSHFSIEQMTCDDYDADAGLEYEDNETYLHFCEFYEDVLPEFKKAGKVCQFKVCCNPEPHLRGNVYVQYSRREEAEEAFRVFNSRWYGGKQLSCEFTDVKNWKSAICGLYHRNRCPKGSSCNFLHVFKNPHNEFWEADQNVERNYHRNYHYRSQYRNFHYTTDYHGKKRYRSASPHKEHYVRSSSSCSSSSSSSPYSKKKRHKKHKNKRGKKSKTRSHRYKKSRDRSPAIKSGRKRH